MLGFGPSIGRLTERVEKALEVAELCLRQKELVGAIAVGRAGLGYFQRTQVSKAWGKYPTGGRAVEQSSRPQAAWRMDQVVF